MDTIFMLIDPPAFHRIHYVVSLPARNMTVPSGLTFTKGNFKFQYPSEKDELKLGKQFDGLEFEPALYQYGTDIKSVIPLPHRDMN